MKKIILLTLLCTSAFSNTSFDKVDLIEGFASNYELSSKMHSKKANLDCQSFFHKFDLYDQNNNLVYENYITQSECNILATKIQVCLESSKTVCFKPDSIYDSNCNCAD